MKSLTLNHWKEIKKIKNKKTIFQKETSIKIKSLIYIDEPKIHRETDKRDKEQEVTRIGDSPTNFVEKYAGENGFTVKRNLLSESTQNKLH